MITLNDFEKFSTIAKEMVINSANKFDDENNFKHSLFEIARFGNEIQGDVLVYKDIAIVEAINPKTKESEFRAIIKRNTNAVEKELSIVPIEGWIKTPYGFDRMIAAIIFVYLYKNGESASYADSIATMIARLEEK